MKKKLLCVVLTLCIAIPCAFASIGCNNTNPPKTSLTKADYVEAIDSMTTNFNAYLNQPAQQASSFSVVLEESDFINQDGVANTKQLLAGAMALVLFMKNVLNTDGYVLKTTTDDCVASYDNGHSVETFDIRFKFSYEASTSTINIPVYAEYNYGNPSSPTRFINYFIFEIVYDFTTDSLDHFTVCGFIGPKDNQTVDGVEFYKYKDNSVSRLDPSSSKKVPFSQGILDGMADFMSAEWETSPEDYTQQYSDAMNATNPN